MVFDPSNYYLNFYALPVSLTGIVVVALGVWIFLSKKDSPANTSFLALCLSTGLWMGGLSLTYLSRDSALAAFWFTATFLGITMLSASMFTFTVIFLNKDRLFKRLIPLAYLLSLSFFYLFIRSEGFLIGMKQYFWGWYPVYGPISYLFLAQWCLFMLSGPLLFLHALGATTASIERQRIKYMLLGFCIGYIGMIDFLAAYGVVVYPFGYMPVLSFIAIIAYTMKKYRLFLTPSMAADTILNTMADALMVFGSDGKIVAVNPVSLRLFGHESGVLTQMSARDIFLEKDVFEKDKLASIAANGSVRNIEMTALSSSGGGIPVSLSIGVVKDGGGLVKGYVAIARDNRETKRFIEELKTKTWETQKELSERMKAEQALKEAYVQLQAAQARLLQSEKMAAVGQLAGGVAHEINNPLGVILGFAQSMLTKVKQDDQFSMPLLSIEREAKRCRNLVRDLLLFSRADRHEKETSDINKVVLSALSLIEDDARFSSVELVYELAKDIKQIDVNRGQIQQMIINLCNNAMDAMEGKGRLTVKSGMLEGGDDVELQVSDTGTGIPEEIKNKIYEPFFTTKEVGKGTGLGLSLVYEIVKTHYGKIEFESEAGKGTTFRIALPGKKSADQNSVAG